TRSASATPTGPRRRSWRTRRPRSRKSGRRGVSERARLPRVGVDTNLHVSGAISALGNPARLLEAWRAGRFRLLISTEQRAEIEEALRRPRIARRYRLSEEYVRALLRRLDQDAVRVRPARRLPMHVRDRD